VTAPLGFGLLGPILSEFLERHPDVQVELMCTDRRVDLVEEGFDVAIRAGHLDDSTHVARVLGSIQRILVAAPTYCKRNGTPRAPADLARHVCIAFGSGAAANRWVLQRGGQKSDVRIHPRLTVNDFDLMVDAVRKGLGVAAMPSFMVAEDLKRGRLRQVLPEWSSAETPIHALYPTARHLSPKVATFLDLLRERFSLE
jgi:DNA-binding transcriptional LysR family regulator